MGERKNKSRYFILDMDFLLSYGPLNSWACGPHLGFLLDFESLINSPTFPCKKHLLTTNSVSPGPSSTPDTELKQPGLSPWQAQRLLMGYFMVPSSRHGFPALSVVPIEGRVCRAERGLPTPGTSSQARSWGQGRTG